MPLARVLSQRFVNKVAGASPGSSLGAVAVQANGALFLLWWATKWPILPINALTLEKLPLQIARCVIRTNQRST